MNLRSALGRVRQVLLRPDYTRAEWKAGDLLLPYCSAGAAITASETPGVPALRISLYAGPQPWFELSTSPQGEIALSGSHGSLLIALSGLVSEEWSERDVAEFLAPSRRTPSFGWLRNLSDFAVGSLRNARGFDRAGYMLQLARQGFTHVTVNGLGVQRPFESGPPGDVYHWFYDYSPDLDQFVESRLLAGYYPAEYLAANLEFLKRGASAAVAAGLVPGLHINSPRSLPEAFWARNGHLRGARVDHPRETLLPRYTLAMAHPATQEHYRELIRKIMKEIPEIGFVHCWTNDSGSGFEFVTTLYAGRNGGPYLIREWKDHAEIARKAGENALTYFHLLRDEGRRVNPVFRLICDLGPFRDERPTVIAGMGDGIDAGDFGYFDRGTSEVDRDLLNRAGASVHEKVDIAENTLPGLPFPRLVHERLSAASGRGDRRILAGGTPESLAPYDINREVLRAFQLMPERPLSETLVKWGEEWGGESAAELLKAWDLSDSSARAFPSGVPYSTFAFPWLRLWVRPFVPDIEAIPERERAYYERFLLATFNNPARVDLNNDMMWNFLTPAEAGEKKRQIDRLVLLPIEEGISLCGAVAEMRGNDVPPAFPDLHDRLTAARCFFGTLRNMLAWTEGVHGYLRAAGEGEKEACLLAVREMVANELDNARRLLALWRQSRTAFMPIVSHEETLHAYGENFGELVERKIILMEAYGDREPRIDPGFMWRMPVEEREGGR